MWTISRALARSTCFPVPAAASSAECFLDGGPSAQSSSAAIAGRCWSPGRMTGLLTLSRYGTTCELLTDDRGAGAAIYCVAAFRARIYRPSATAPASTEASRASGVSSPASPARPGRSGCSSRTRRTSSSSDSTSYYEILPRSGTMRSGRACPRPSSAPPTSGTGYGYLPRIHDREYATELAKLEETIIKLWAGEPARLPKKEFAFWPTPTRSDARNTGTPGQLVRRYIPLSCRVRIREDGTFDASGGRANPEFVEWLMAWPMGWTALKPLETDRLRTWLQGLSPSCRQGSETSGGGGA